MENKLDLYDKKILYELDKDARQAYTSIAKKVKLNKDTIKYRMNSYLDNNLVSGFYTLIDSSKLGFYSIRVYFNLKEITLENENNFIAYLMKEENIFYFSENDGEYKYGIGIFAKTLHEFQEYWQSLKKRFPNKISKERIDLFLELEHFNRNYLINTKVDRQKGYKIINEPSKEYIDEINLEILEIMADNARISIIDIASKVKLTSKAIIYRIRELERKEIILGYKPKINLENLGYSMYKIDIKLLDNVDIDSITNKIKQLSNIIHFEKTLGGPNLEFDLECSNYNELNQIINDIRKLIGQSIIEIKYYRTTKVYKTLYMPKIL